jgi:hypothetical protein
MFRLEQVKGRNQNRTLCEAAVCFAEQVLPGHAIF